MPQLPMNLLVLPLGQASWMTSWLTPIWFYAMGIAIGLVALGIFAIVFRLLSNIAAWEQLSRSPAGHIAAGVITIVLAAGSWFSLRRMIGGTGEEGDFEPLLLGIALTLICAVVGWAIVFCSGKQASKEAFATLGEGAAGFLGISALVIVFIGAAIWGVGLAMETPIVPNPVAAVASIPSLFSSGLQPFTETIDGVPPGETGPFVEFPTDIDFDVLFAVRISSDTTVVLGDAEKPADFKRAPIRLAAGETIEWNARQNKTELPIPIQEGSSLYVQNQEVGATTVTVTAYSKPPVPEAASLLIAAITVLIIGLGILLQQAVAPRVSAVAHATAKNELAQVLFLVLMSIGAVLVLLYEFLPFHTFGEDIKLLKECGITTIMLIAAFQGIWSASSSISEEIEGQTALTILSKPIQRRSFIIGKFMGIFWVILLMFVVLGSLELGAVAYKPIYDAREGSQEMPNWQMCHLEMMRTVPGLALAFMQAVTLTAISVALATRLPQLANLAICLAIYLVGNLSTALVSSTQDAFDIVKFVAQLVATAIPILEHFQLQAAIDGDNPIPMSLLSGSLAYCLLYVMLSMFLALLLFEDRDLA